MSQRIPRVLNKRTDVIPADAEYCGRPSKWGNPFTHLRSKTLAQFQVATVEEAVEAHAAWILNQPELMAAVHELRGKDLVCWCKPEPCHCDTLIELANDPEGH